MHLAFTMDKEPLTNTYFGTDVPIIRCPKSHFKKSPTFLFPKLRASERRLVPNFQYFMSGKNSISMSLANQGEFTRPLFSDIAGVGNFTTLQTNSVPNAMTDFL